MSKSPTKLCGVCKHGSRRRKHAHRASLYKSTKGLSMKQRSKSSKTATPMRHTKALTKAKPVFKKDEIAKGPAGALTLARKKGETIKAAAARFAVGPELGGAITLANYERTTKAELGSMINELHRLGGAAVDGDLSHAERMLTSHAVALDAVFNRLAQKAVGNAGSLEEFEVYLRLALRAQSQARATAETLALMKNPPSVAFVRAQQANLTTGAQQVNNGVTGIDNVARAGESKTTPSKLLEHSYG